MTQQRNHRQWGQWAEQWALEHALKQGWQCIARNFYSRYGEIDLILTEQDTLIFCEVKARQSEAYGSIAEMVTPTKQQRIIRTAHYFLLRYPHYQDWCCRFDVVTVRWQAVRNLDAFSQINPVKYELQWIENAFTL